MYDELRQEQMTLKVIQVRSNSVCRVGTSPIANCTVMMAQLDVDAN